MNNEFKKIKSNNETRYVLETATAGATGTGAVATSVGGMGKVQKRNPDNILAQEGDKIKIDASKPRNFVAKNAKTGGAGAHKDKKKAQKQGQEKHKKPYAENLEDLKGRLAQLKENLADQLAAFAKAHGGKVRTGPQPRKPDAPKSDVKPEPRPAPKYRDPNIDRSDDYSTWAAGRRDTTEGASDFVGDAIEALRSSKPGLGQEDFLDELYMYIENQYGQRAAEMMSNAGQDEFADWYDSYTDMAEGMSEEQGYDEVSPKSASYILRKMEQGVPMSNIIDDFPELSRMMDVIAHEHGLHPDDDFEQIEDVLMNDLEDIAAQEDDFGDYDQDEEQPDEYMESLAQSLQSVLSEKAVSKAQQRFMGMVHAAQKGEKPASKEVAKAAKGMGKKDAKDFAATKHKGLPEKKKAKK
jgi:hypothetical protein